MALEHTLAYSSKPRCNAISAGFSIVHHAHEKSRLGSAGAAFVQRDISKNSGGLLAGQLAQHVLKDAAVTEELAFFRGQ